MWVSTYNGPARYDPTTGMIEVIETLSRGRIAFTNDSIWWIQSGAIQQLDPTTFEPIRSISLVDPLIYVMEAEAMGEILFLADEEGGAITRIDTERREVDWRIDIDPPSRLVLAFDSLWSTSYLGGTITRIDPETGAILGVEAAGRNLNGIAAIDAYIWVIDTASGDLYRFYPEEFASKP